MNYIDVRIAVSDDVDLSDKYGVGDFIAEVVRDGLLGDEGYLLDITTGPLTLPERVSIHPGEYRGQQGFRVRSSLGTSTFVPSRVAAERIRDRLKRGEEPRYPDDYNLPPRRQSRVAGCSTCDRDPAGSQIMPPHDASSRCESGKYSHCSCDTCF